MNYRCAVVFWDQLQLGIDGQGLNGAGSTPIFILDKIANDRLRSYLPDNSWWNHHAVAVAPTCGCIGRQIGHIDASVFASLGKTAVAFEKIRQHIRNQLCDRLCLTELDEVEFSILVKRLIQLRRHRDCDLHRYAVRQFAEFQFRHDDFLSFLVRPKHDILADNHAQRPSRTDGNGGLNVEILFDDALPSLVGRLLRGLFDRLDKIALAASERALLTDAKQRGHSNALQQRPSVIVDLVSKTGIPGGIGGRQVIDLYG
jgi:hypothetical protein